MKRNSVLKKFDKEIENLFDTLYKIKDLLEKVNPQLHSKNKTVYKDLLISVCVNGCV